MISHSRQESRRRRTKSKTSMESVLTLTHIGGPTALLEFGPVRLLN